MRQDLLEGENLLKWGGIPEGLQQSLEKFLLHVESLPEQAVMGRGIEDFQHASWECVRSEAATLLEVLERVSI